MFTVCQQVRATNSLPPAPGRPATQWLIVTYPFGEVRVREVVIRRRSALDAAGRDVIPLVRAPEEGDEWRRSGDRGHGTARVDVLDEGLRFITSADCEIRPRGEGEGWGGMLTGIEPNAHLSSGRYRIRSRDGAEAVITVQARQRIGESERYPFVGEGEIPRFEPA